MLAHFFASVRARDSSIIFIEELCKKNGGVGGEFIATQRLTNRHAC